MSLDTNENIRNKNTQDIFFRNAMLSLIDLMNRNVYIDIIRNDEVEKFSVPFFPNMANDEGFMKDFFMNVPSECKIPVPAEGNYEPIPRGVITWKSFSITSSNITNKFVRGTYNQQERGDSGEKINRAYSARLYSLPMMLKFDIDVLSDNMNKTMKIMQSLIETYYKNNVMYFQYRGIRIPAQFIYPESIDYQKEFEFTYEKDQRVKTKFSVELETYFPSFDDESAMYKGNVVRQWFTRNKNKSGGTNINQKFTDQDYPPSE